MDFMVSDLVFSRQEKTGVTFRAEKVERATLAPIASRMMDAALSNLVNDGHVALATMLSNKEAFGNFLRMLSPHVDAIIIISEAWTLMEEDVDAMDLTIPVSQHPMRVEGVFVSAQSRCGELLLTKTFKRDAHEKAVLHGEIKEIWTSAPIRSTGNFSNLFGSSEACLCTVASLVDVSRECVATSYNTN
eukprot:5720098-Prymnesium_polylepis.2